MDSEGNFIKSFNFGGADFDFTRHVEHMPGHLIVAGGTTSSDYEILGNTYQQIASTQDVFLFKLDNNLNELVWFINDFNNAGLNFHNSLSCTDSLINVSGFFGNYETRMYDADGQFLWGDVFETSNSVLSEMDVQHVYVAIDSFDVEMVNGNPVEHIYKHKLLKYDLQGNLLREGDIVNYLTPSSLGVFRIAGMEIAEDGAVVLAGVIEGPVEFDGMVFNEDGLARGFILKIDSAGNPAWFTIVGAEVSGDWHNLSSDGTHYWLNWSEKVDFQHAPVFRLEKYATDGTLLASSEIVSTQSITGLDLEVAGEQLYVAGSFKGQAAFPDQTIQSTGFYDALVWKYDLSAMSSVDANPEGAKAVTLSPNPAGEFVLVESASLIRQISVFDMLGRLVLQKLGVNAHRYELDLTKLSRGSYFIWVDNGRNSTGKILKH